MAAIIFFRVVNSSGKYVNATIDEAKEALGIVSIPVPPPVPGVPDLIVKNLTWSPAQPKEGDAVTFTSVIRNQGTGPTTAGVILGVRYSIDGAVAAWTDTYTTALPAGKEVTLTSGNRWTAVAGTHVAQAWVDDVNRMPEETPKTNNTLDKPLVVSGVVIIPPPVSAAVPPPSGTVRVATINDFINAMNSGAKDITLTAAVRAPDNGLFVPRNGLTLRCEGDGILNRGSRNGNVLTCGDGGGGSIKCINFRVDGGWRTWPLEDLNYCNNYWFPDMDYVRMEGCVSCYSLSTGFYLAGSRQVEVVGCTTFVAPRDHVWARGCNDLLVDSCLVQHCGDDGIGAHLQGGSGPVVRSMVFTNNILRDSNGMKLHAGSLTGVINGKPGQVLIANNTYEACSLYAIHGEDNPVEQTQDPINIFFKNNIVRDLRKTTPFSPGQVIGKAVILAWPGRNFTNVHVENNQFIQSNAGQRLRDVYIWAGPSKPANVPGASNYVGGFSKTQNLPDATIDIASQATELQGNNTSAIVFAGNTWQGYGNPPK